MQSPLQILRRGGGKAIAPEPLGDRDWTGDSENGPWTLHAHWWTNASTSPKCYYNFRPICKTNSCLLLSKVRSDICNIEEYKKPISMRAAIWAYNTGCPRLPFLENGHGSDTIPGPLWQVVVQFSVMVEDQQKLYHHFQEHLLHPAASDHQQMLHFLKVTFNNVNANLQEWAEARADSTRRNSGMTTFTFVRSLLCEFVRLHVNNNNLILRMTMNWWPLTCTALAFENDNEPTTFDLHSIEWQWTDLHSIGIWWTDDLWSGIWEYIFLLICPWFNKVLNG